MCSSDLLAQQPQVVRRVVDEQAVLLQQSENAVTDFRPGRRITYHRVINAMHGISVFRDGYSGIDEGIDERMPVVVQGGDFNDAAGSAGPARIRVPSTGRSDVDPGRGYGGSVRCRGFP